MARTEKSCWLYAQSSEHRGVVLIVHGLNQRPSSWHQLTSQFNLIGLHVYRLSLKGHRGLGFGDMQNVSASIWETEMREAYEEIEHKFPGSPRYLVGFSLGCLLAQTVQLKIGHRYFDRQMLLAPALAVQPYTRLVLPFCRLLDALPSRSPKYYVANREGTSAAAYRALFTLLRDFRRFTDLHLLNMPTTVLMRSDDELVSYKGTLKLMAQFRLDRWRMVRLTDDASLCKRWRSYKHLILDKQSAGEEVWNQIVSEVHDFFLTDKTESN